MGGQNGQNGQTLTKAFVPLPGKATAVYNSSGLAWYRHPDWLGSSRIASLPSGSSRINYDGAYSPYGESYAENNPPVIDRSFTGQNQDLTPNGDMYDFLYRQYHAPQGRWISPDPAGVAAVDPANPQSWNRYAYVNNSPLDSMDPLGLFISGNSAITVNTTLTFWSNGCLYIRQMTIVGTPNDWSDSWVVLGDPEEVICLSQPTQQVPQPGTPGPGAGSSGSGQSRANDCPLSAPSGDYRVADAVASFAPDMATNISSGFSALNQLGIVPTMNSVSEPRLANWRRRTRPTGQHRCPGIRSVKRLTLSPKTRTSR